MFFWHLKKKFIAFNVYIYTILIVVSVAESPFLRFWSVFNVIIWFVVNHILHIGKTTTLYLLLEFKYWVFYFTNYW